MFGTLKGRLLVLAVVVIAAVATIATKQIMFGLDLRGGVYLALEVPDSAGTMAPEVRKEHTANNLEILRNRLDQFGVSEPSVRASGDYRILVELPGLTDPDRAEAVIAQQAFLEWTHVLDVTPLISALPRMDRAVAAGLGPDEELEAPSADTTARMRDEVRRRLFEQTGASTDSVGADSAAAGDSAAVGDSATAADSLATAPGAQPLSSLLGAVSGTELQVRAEDVDRVKRYLAIPGVIELLPRNTALVWAADEVASGAQLYRSLFLLEDEAFLTGERLETATAGRDPQYGGTIVTFQLDRRGGRDFDRETAANIGNRIAIVLDNQVHSAPVVNTRIGASGQIDMGQSPMAEAQDLALVLRAGAFSAPLQIIEKRQIGPSLGQDAIDQGKIAGIIGVLAVVIIMIMYYRVAGMLAVVALAIYLLLVLAGLVTMGAKLTAPGIAGLILSLGMAVDANVLIFERIREELALGRTPRAAIDNGFQHAMSAIVDSNITTLITALILYQVGTGPVRGFAVTLSIGIVASFFSAVFITRTFFMLYMDRRSTADAVSI